MALPLIGIALRAIMTSSLGGAVKGMAAPTIQISLAQGGRGIRRKVKRMTRRTERAALRATNRVGQQARIRATLALALALDVSPATVKKVSKAQSARPGSKRPVYTIRWRSDRMPVARVRAKEFKAYRGSGGKRGKLSLKLWKSGRRVVLEGVEKRGRTFILPARGALPERAVGGPRITRGSAPSRAALDPIRRTLPTLLRREFKRQLKLARRRR